MKEHINWKKFILITGMIWILQGAYSTLNSGLIQQYSEMQVRWMAISIYSFGAAFVWWLLTPIIFWIILSVARRVKSLYIIIGMHLLLAVVFASIQRLINIAIVYNTIKLTEAVDLSLLKLENFFGMNFIRNVGNGILVYLVITGILYGYVFYLKNRMQEAQQSKLTAALSKLKIENLKYQLQPHFLFNSLQSISTLIHRDTKAADQALGNLGDLLRYSIRNIDTEKVTLGEELMSLQKFIDLQQTRFAEKLKVAIDFEEGLMAALVPSFLLQPIIENSIKHNIEETGEPVEIRVQVIKVENKLFLKIEDNGKHEKNLLKQNGNGMGIKNLNLRLEALYAEKYFFKSQHLDPLGFQTTIQIPFELQK